MNPYPKIPAAKMLRRLEKHPSDFYKHWAICLVVLTGMVILQQFFNVSIMMVLIVLLCAGVCESIMYKRIAIVWKKRFPAWL